MWGDLSKKNRIMLAATLPLIAGLTYLALSSLRSVQPVIPETRDVSFKIEFDDRVTFPQTIRQRTIEKLLGLEYQIVAPRHSTGVPTGERSSEASDGGDCHFNRHGGFLTLRVPQSASSVEIAGRLEQLGRIKSATIDIKK